MRYNPKARLDRSQVENRRGGGGGGGGGFPVGGGGGGLKVGGGIGGLVVVVLIFLLQSQLGGSADWWHGTGPSRAPRSTSAGPARTRTRTPTAPWSPTSTRSSPTGTEALPQQAGTATPRPDAIFTGE